MSYPLSNYYYPIINVCSDCRHKKGAPAPPLNIVGIAKIEIYYCECSCHKEKLNWTSPNTAARKKIYR